jgi:CheY-like chemotaxis protein
LAAADAPAAKAAARAPAAVPVRRILIVDDNRDAAWSLRVMLRMDGHDAELVETAAAALEAARRKPPEIVLLDIGLPDMDGYALARALREDPVTRDALIIATTGYGREQDREKSRAAGIDAHLTKPIDMDQLAALIAREPRRRT